MNAITADDVLRQSLHGLESLTEIRDSQGRIVGYFSPVVESSIAEVYSLEVANFNVREMQHRKQSGEPGQNAID